MNPDTRVIPPANQQRPLNPVPPRQANYWSTRDERAEFIIKIAPPALLLLCLVISCAGMLLQREYPNLVEIIASGCLGALNPGGLNKK